MPQIVIYTKLSEIRKVELDRLPKRSPRPWLNQYYLKESEPLKTEVLGAYWEKDEWKVDLDIGGATFTGPLKVVFGGTPLFTTIKIFGGFMDIILE